MKKISLLVALAFLAGCIPYFAQVCGERHINAIKSVVCEIKVTAVSEKDNQPLEHKTIGFSIGNGYIVALSHATVMLEYVNIRSMFGIISTPRPVKDIKYFANGEVIELIGRHEDISVFYNPAFKNALPFADSDKVKVGTNVYTIGFSFSKMFNFKNGVISAVNIPPKAYDSYLEKCFLTTCPANPGDSGSPLIAINNEGNPEVIGIICAVVNGRGMSFAFKSNYVKEAIAKILKK